MCNMMGIGVRNQKTTPPQLSGAMLLIGNSYVNDSLFSLPTRLSKTA